MFGKNVIYKHLKTKIVFQKNILGSNLSGKAIILLWINKNQTNFILVQNGSFFRVACSIVDKKKNGPDRI